MNHFQEEELKSLSYFLPVNLAEAERLMAQHLVLIDALDGRIVLPRIDLEQPGLKILDSGTADGFSGHWISELRKTLPSPDIHTYVGTDINPSLFPKTLPPDTSFCLFALLKPAGWIQLVEAEQEGPESGPVFQEFLDLVRGLFTATGAGWHYAKEIRQWLEEAGAVDVDEYVVDMAFGAKNPDKYLAEISAVPTPDLVDTLIVGGGPAGLTSAVTVARNLHTAIVFDSHDYRNERTAHFHMMPTWDGKNPIAFRDAARQNTIDNYDTIFYVDIKIDKAVKNNEGLFELTDAGGKVWKGRSLVLASGIIDVPVDIPGFEECWGRSIFHCLFCHGYEQRGSVSSGILAIDDVAPIPICLHVARNAAQMTKSGTIYTHGNATSAAQIQEAIGPMAPFTVDSRRITKFELGADDGITLHFEDGTSKEEAFLAHKPKSALKSRFLAEHLNLNVTPQ
ncbi:hypothetical protein F4859DRAFT_522428 [Xylaria cf. heliscus]|nr:hypothetical protein F4859DRAFT_522428 [Xylaria cf. heliscus]